MKIAFNTRNNFFTLLLLLLINNNIFSISQFKLFQDYETCLRPCMICQNTLYHLKFHSNIKCSEKECPGLVLLLLNFLNYFL